MRVVPVPPLVLALNALYETRDMLARARVHNANFQVYSRYPAVPGAAAGQPPVRACPCSAAAVGGGGGAGCGQSTERGVAGGQGQG